MVDVPESVIIGPYTYRIEADKEWTDSHNAWAHIQYGRQRIRIDPSTEPDRMRVAVVHEILHGIHEVTNVIGEKWEESLVTQDAPLIVQVLRDNPALVAYLLDGSDQ